MSASTAQPYPSAPKGTEPPVSPLTAAELADETGADLTRAERVLGVVVLLVNRYAPDAPEELRREAAIRAGGYLLGSDYGAVRSETVGPRSVEYVVNHAAYWRNSGAAALLTRWRQRRAGVC